MPDDANIILCGPEPGWPLFWQILLSLIVIVGNIIVVAK
jgi:hypothetical protein